jgi:hypothetical protein
VAHARNMRLIGENRLKVGLVPARTVLDNTACGP